MNEGIEKHTLVTTVKITKIENFPLLDPNAAGVDPDDSDTWPVIGVINFYRSEIQIGNRRMRMEGPEGLDADAYNKLVDAIANVLKNDKRPELTEVPGDLFVLPKDWLVLSDAAKTH